MLAQSWPAIYDVGQHWTSIGSTSVFVGSFQQTRDIGPMCFILVPPSAPSAQHWPQIGSTSWVCWVMMAPYLQSVISIAFTSDDFLYSAQKLRCMCLLVLDTKHIVVSVCLCMECEQTTAWHKDGALELYVYVEWCLDGEFACNRNDPHIFSHIHIMRKLIAYSTY